MYRVVAKEKRWAVVDRFGSIVKNGLGPSAAMLMASRLNWEDIAKNNPMLM